MAISRTKAILNVLARGREEDLARRILKIFGASSIEECHAAYDALGAAERAGLDAAISRMAADASAAFLLSVDMEAS